MNRRQVVAALNKAGIPKQFYSFKGDGDSEGANYRLVQDGEQWQVYFADGDDKKGFASFETEHDACRFFLDKILNDEAIRKVVDAESGQHKRRR